MKTNWNIYWLPSENSWILEGLNDHKRYRINRQILHTLASHWQSKLLVNEMIGGIKYFGEIHACTLVKMQRIPIKPDDQKPMFFDSQGIPHYDCTLPDWQVVAKAHVPADQKPMYEVPIQEQYLREACYELHKVRCDGKYHKKIKASCFEELPSNMKYEYRQWVLAVFRYLDRHGVEIVLQQPMVTQRLVE